MEKSELRQILIDQQIEHSRALKELRPREQIADLSKLVAQSKLVKVILGARRSGKSSLCHQSLAHRSAAYVNFDDERLIGLDTADLQAVFETLKELQPESEVLFFDELQNIPDWELFVNRLQRNGHNVLLTGSNGKLLSTDLATHLTGRSISLTLYPISFTEFLRWRSVTIPTATSVLPTGTRIELSRLFDEYFELGGFPEVVLGEPQGYYLRELFDKIVTRDIVQRHKVRDYRILKEIGLYLLQHSAQLVSYDNVKKHFNLASITTTRKYVQYLIDVFLIHELKAYSYKLKERSTARRKIYACDVGMMNAVWSKPSKDLGAKFETQIFLYLIARGEEVYYLNEDEREVDFCVVRDGKPAELIQACYTLRDVKTRKRELRAIVDLGKRYKVNKLVIVTRDEEEEITLDETTIKVVPAFTFFLGLDV